MCKSQSIEFIKEINRNDDEDDYDIDEYINKLFSYNIDKDGYLIIILIVFMILNN